LGKKKAVEGRAGGGSGQVCLPYCSKPKKSKKTRTLTRKRKSSSEHKNKNCVDMTKKGSTQKKRGGGGGGKSRVRKRYKGSHVKGLWGGGFFLFSTGGEILGNSPKRKGEHNGGNQGPALMTLKNDDRPIRKKKKMGR